MTRRILIRVPNCAATSVLSVRAAAVEAAAACPARVRDGSRAASGRAAHSRPRAMTRTGVPDRAALPIHHHRLHPHPDRVPAGASAAPVTAASGLPVAPVAVASGRVLVPAVRPVPGAAACSDRAAASAPAAVRAAAPAVVPAAVRADRRSGPLQDQVDLAAGRASARAPMTAAVPAVDQVLVRGRLRVPAGRASAHARTIAAVPVDAPTTANPTCARRNPPAIARRKAAA